jgi:2-desacetyl-2-hydroxyethyl bacteriochlorophyllide A dehydrogenase
MKADALWIVEPNKMEVRPFEVNEPKYDEVMFKTKAGGVCCWDSSLYQGISAVEPLPYVIGHESVGIIEKVGEGVTNIKPGDKVFCASGSNNMMCKYVTVKSDCVVKIDDDTTDWVAAVTEPTCCVVNVLYKTHIEPGDHVVLIGAGYMGTLTLQGLTRGSQAGRITVFEIREDRRELAKAYNPYEVLDPNSDEGKKVIDEIIAKGGADVVIDFSAAKSGFELANELFKMAGKLIIGSWHRDEMAFDGTKWHLNGITVYNLSPMSNAHYTEILPRTLELIKRGVYEPGKLVTHVANYKDCKDVFLRSIDKKDGYMKGVILFEE